MTKLPHTLAAIAVVLAGCENATAPVESSEGLLPTLASAHSSNPLWTFYIWHGVRKGSGFNTATCSTKGSRYCTM